MTVGQLGRAAGVSRSTAHKWRKVLRAEAEGRAQWASVLREPGPSEEWRYWLRTSN
jgi:hypothetical protein